MIVEDPRRGITEMNRIRHLVAQGVQRYRGAPPVDGNAVVQAIVKELECSGAHMPESTKFVLRYAAASVLLLMEAPK